MADQSEQGDLPVLYQFSGHQLNPDYAAGITILKAPSEPVYKAGAKGRPREALRSCPIHNNAENKTTLFYIARQPKWITKMQTFSPDENGELIQGDDYLTNDIKASKMRKIKAVNKFVDFYEPLYQKRKVSLLFHTFTRLQYSRADMRRMMDAAKHRYKQINREIRGYIWVLEVSDNNHIHYHLVVAINRLQVKEIPEAIKFQDLWGQRTGVEFIRKSIRAYLCKYLYKNDSKLLSNRNYSVSRKLK